MKPHELAQELFWSIKSYKEGGMSLEELLFEAYLEGPTEADLEAAHEEGFRDGENL